MATKMLTRGAVQFGGQEIALGRASLVNGRMGTPFMAWVRPEGTTIRVKWASKHTYMPSDFSERYGPTVVFSEPVAA